MKLKDYLEKNGLRTGWFAKQIPCTTTYVCGITSGRYNPSILIKNRIVELTSGQVTLDDFCDPEKKVEA